jgi:K+-sensing histidine kinase KdpD
VRDYGYGIAPENIDKLFIDFGKLSDDKKLNREGVGLGLSICKSLI